MRAIALLAVVALGLSAGAMLAEGAVLVPFWRALPADAFLRWYADNASLLLDFYAPLEIIALALAAAAAALPQVRRQADARWLVAAALLALAVLLPFPFYFQRVNASFAAGSIALERVGTELARWAAVHWLRTGLGIAAFAAALVAVAGHRTASAPRRTA